MSNWWMDCKNVIFFSRWLFEIIHIIRFEMRMDSRINLKIFLGYDINYLSIWPFMHMRTWARSERDKFKWTRKWARNETNRGLNFYNRYNYIPTIHAIYFRVSDILLAVCQQRIGQSTLIFNKEPLKPEGHGLLHGYVRFSRYEKEGLIKQVLHICSTCKVGNRDVHLECSKQFKWNLYFYVFGHSWPFG